MRTTDKTLHKIKKAFETMRKGQPAKASWRQLRMNDGTFYDAVNADPELMADYKQATAQGEIYLWGGAIDEPKTVAGKIHAINRIYGKNYGKHKEEELELTISPATREVMINDDSTGEQKIAALTKDFYAQKIQLPLFEKLIGIVKLSHPEMSKTEISGDITISDALLKPTK